MPFGTSRRPADRRAERDDSSSSASQPTGLGGKLLSLVVRSGKTSEEGFCSRRNKKSSTGLWRTPSSVGSGFRANVRSATVIARGTTEIWCFIVTGPQDFRGPS